MIRPAFSCHGKRSQNSYSGRGFTLVEMLVVMAIIAILAVLTMPAINGTLSGINLKGSKNTVVGLLNSARQTANTRNLQVDFRVYKDPSANNAYHIMALVIPASASGAATDEYVGKPVALPGDVIVDPSTTYSSLLNTTASGTLPPTAGTELASAPLLVRGLTYVKFTFLPNGSLYLDSTVNWCLSLKNLHKASAGGTPAANYVVIVMDTQSARPSIYQP